MSPSTDTIAALATPSGTAALATIRISGPDTYRLSSQLFGAAPRLRSATHGDYVGREGSILDAVVATRYAAPHSYTGEDSLEISCHGSPLVVHRILVDLLARGCRAAGPGEFTQRAFLNGRMDLSQAEAVMDVISARSDRALAAAQQVLRGALGRHLAKLVEGVVAALSTVEAYIDFPEEDLPLEDRKRLEERIAEVLRGTEQLLATERTGAYLREGMATVILGAPNAGKSSLMNRIVGTERAIVSPEPGTTRDFIEEVARVGPHGLRLVDTAGLNPDAAGIESVGIGKTLERAAGADLYMLVLDATRPAPPLPDALGGRIAPSNTLVVVNKVDLLAEGGKPVPSILPGFQSVRVSALTGDGMDSLLDGLSRMADGLQQTFGDERITINVRHSHFLVEARACLQSALAKVATNGPGELLASDLRGAMGALGEIFGKVDNERVLDQLFASFCIGK